MVEGRRVDRRLGSQRGNTEDMGQAGALPGQRGHMLSSKQFSLKSPLATSLCYVSISRVVYNAHLLNIVLSVLCVPCIVLDAIATKGKHCSLP